MAHNKDSKKTKTSIMSKVDILDLIDIEVSQPYPGYLEVSLTPFDDTKEVVMDDGARNVLNEALTSKTEGANAKNPNTTGFIKEFTGKMISEFYRNGLLEIQDVTEAPKDPYADAKKQVKKLLH